MMLIQLLIRRRGLKQKWVAKQIGLDPARLSLIARGHSQLPIDKITILAQTLGVSNDEMLKLAGVYAPRRRSHKKREAANAQSF